MKPFVFGHWHAWQGTSAIMLSDESSKQLSEFPDTDACITWLFTNGHRDAARALNKHVKAG